MQAAGLSKLWPFTPPEESGALLDPIRELAQQFYWTGAAHGAIAGFFGALALVCLILLVACLIRRDSVGYSVGLFSVLVALGLSYAGIVAQRKPAPPLPVVHPFGPPEPADTRLDKPEKPWRPFHPRGEVE